jgi:hypothetical protein
VVALLLKSGVSLAVVVLAFAPTVCADPLPLSSPLNFEGQYDPLTHTVTLSWNAPFEAGNQSLSYNVYFNGALVATVETTGYHDTLTLGPEPQAYWVRAVSNAVEGAPSKPYLATVSGLPCLVPFHTVVLDHFPFLDFLYDPECLPDEAPDPFTIIHPHPR